MTCPLCATELPPPVGELHTCTGCGAEAVRVRPCLNCRSPLLAPDDDGWRRCPQGCGYFHHGPDGPHTHDDLAAERAEDEATLSDYLAAEGVGIDRSRGAL